MAVPKGNEVEYEGVAYILVDADLLLRLNPGKNVCSLCELRTPCGALTASSMAQKSASTSGN